MAKLVFHSGAYQGKRVTLPPGKSITLGRNRDIDLPLPDPKLSRKHCQIVSRSDQFILRDLNSTNGTFINGTRLNGEYQLKPFDRIVLGDIELEFLDEVSARMTPDKARTAVGSPAVNFAPGPKTAAGTIDSEDLLEDLVEDAPATPSKPAAPEPAAVEVVEEVGDLLEDVAEPEPPVAAPQQAAAAEAGEIISEEPLEEINPADQIPVPVPARAISAPPGKSGRLAPGFLPPPAAQAAPPAVEAPIEDAIEDTDPNAGDGTAEEQAPMDPLEEALYEVSLPLPPDPPAIQNQEQRPKVLFCDGCDASIPLLDWDLNLAQSRNGKTYCPQCLPKAGRANANGGHASAAAAPARQARLQQARPASVTPMPPGHNSPPAASAPPQEKRISDILAGLDEEAVVVDTTVKRRGQVVQDEEISKQLQTLEDVQQKTGGNAPAPAGRPSHNVAGRRPAGFLGGNPPAQAPARAPAAAPVARPPAAQPQAKSEQAEEPPLLEDLEEI